MKVLELATGVTVTASTTVNQTAVDMTTKDLPFTPGNSAIAAIVLRAAANVTVNVQKSSDGTTWTTVATSGAITTAETRTLFKEVSLSDYMRVQTVGVASAAGTADVVLLQN